MTAALATATTWRVPRESSQFVGPLTITLTIDGVPTPVTGVKFAVLPEGVHPTDADWADPIVDPDDADAIGVDVEPVPDAGRWGIWVQVTAPPRAPVLDPDQVGWIMRP